MHVDGSDTAHSIDDMMAAVDVDDVDLESDDDPSSAASSVTGARGTPRYKTTKLTPFTKPPKSEMSPEEWEVVLSNYVKQPKTTLDEEREKYYSGLDTVSPQDADEEHELYEWKKMRMENKIILKARLEHMYEQKEAARRAAEWKRRQVFKGFSVPKPKLPYKSLKR